MSCKTPGETNGRLQGGLFNRRQEKLPTEFFRNESFANGDALASPTPL
jgi:hypothetical protein